MILDGVQSSQEKNSFKVRIFFFFSLFFSFFWLFLYIFLIVIKLNASATYTRSGNNKRVEKM